MDIEPLADDPGADPAIESPGTENSADTTTDLGSRVKAALAAEEVPNSAESATAVSSALRHDFPDVQALEAELFRERWRARLRAVVRSTLAILVVVAAISVLVASLFLPVLKVYGTSMEPTLVEGDYVVSVKGTSYDKGAIYAFYYQNNILVKRLIATEGDWVDIDEDTGQVYVNGVALDESYLPEGSLDYGTVTISLPYQVPDGCLFMMGDDRSVSIDSRTVEVGCVTSEYLVGKIVWRIWPLSSFGVVG